MIGSFGPMVFKALPEFTGFGYMVHKALPAAQRALGLYWFSLASAASEGFR